MRKNNRDSNSNQPHVGSKIRELREAKGYTQEALALAIYTDRSMLSLIECGHKACTNELIDNVRTYFGVDWLPFYESESMEFRSKLFKWNEIISLNDWEAAQEMRERLSIIKFLPSEKELNLFYNLFECRILMGTNELGAAKEIIDTIEPRLGELSDVQLYYYNYNKGTYSVKFKQYSIALKFYLNAYAIMQCGLEQNISIYYGIAFCYYSVGKIASSISFLEKAKKMFSNSHNVNFKMNVDILLAANCIRTGHLHRAKIILDECYVNAFKDDKKAHLALIIIRQGYMYRMAKKWNTAIEHFDKAFIYLTKESQNYKEALYQKIRCLIELGRFSLCEDLIAEGIELSKEDETYLILFKSSKHLMTLGDKKSIKYIETVTIPHLLNINVVVTALDFCKILKVYFKENVGYKKSEQKVREVICQIYCDMLEGDDVELVCFLL